MVMGNLCEYPIKSNNHKHLTFVVVDWGRKDYWEEKLGDKDKWEKNLSQKKW